jgi:hypothetical protein
MLAGVKREQSVGLAKVTMTEDDSLGAEGTEIGHQLSAISCG